MTNIIPLPLRGSVHAASLHPAVERLEGIRDALSSLETSNLRTLAEMSRNLAILDMANKCISIVLNDFRDVPATSHLLAQSTALNSLIETAREKVASLSPRAV